MYLYKSSLPLIFEEMKLFFKKIWNLAVKILNKWMDDRSPKMAAALSYYTVFSMAPILIIAVTVAGILFNKEEARHQIILQVQNLIGSQSAVAIESFMSNASKDHSGLRATILGTIALLFGATGAFTELQDSLNSIWGVRRKTSGGLKAFFKQRLVSFAMVLVIGFLLLVSLVLSAVLSGVDAWFANEHLLPGGSRLWLMANFLASFFVITFLFALIFKVLPDAKVKWKDVWIGALFTSLLFEIGKYFIGIYLGRSAIASTYGAAGSLAIIFIWVYYAAQILFLGAEITQVYATEYGSKSEILSKRFS
ncbi:MAG: ribonuclease [Bacteriovoracaceae bacterium]|nr:ribonuclease [Bacteriovoracaceae bacterium]